MLNLGLEICQLSKTKVESFITINSDREIGLNVKDCSPLKGCAKFWTLQIHDLWIDFPVHVQNYG